MAQNLYIGLVGMGAEPATHPWRRFVKFRAITAAAAALTLGFAGAIAIAAPATADESDIVTPDWLWLAVTDDALYIEDVYSYYADFKGSGVEIDGWTDDAFDGFLNEVNLLWDGGSYQYVLTPVSADYVDNGLSTIVASGVQSINGNDITLTSTLEIQGGTARWSFDFAGDAATLADTQLEILGELGSDGNSVYTPIATGGLVSSEGPDGGDPILGYSSNGTNLAIDAVDGDDVVTFVSDAVNDTTLTVGFIEFDVCSVDAAVAAMTAAVPTLGAQFGTTFAPQYSDTCATVAAPVVTAGKVNVDLPITSSDLLTDWGYFDVEGTSNLGVIPEGLPAGLALTISYVGTVPTLHLTGTAPAGHYDVTAWVYIPFDGEEGPFNGYPLKVTFSFGTALAATGSAQPTPAIIGGSVLALLGVTLVLVASRRRIRTNA
jgi:hypothetical protein